MCSIELNRYDGVNGRQYSRSNTVSVTITIISQLERMSLGGNKMVLNYLRAFIWGVIMSSFPVTMKLLKGVATCQNSIIILLHRFVMKICVSPFQKVTRFCLFSVACKSKLKISDS